MLSPSTTGASTYTPVAEASTDLPVIIASPQVPFLSRVSACTPTKDTLLAAVMAACPSQSPDGSPAPPRLFWRGRAQLHAILPPACSMPYLPARCGRDNPYKRCLSARAEAPVAAAMMTRPSSNSGWLPSTGAPSGVVACSSMPHPPLSWTRVPMPRATAAAPRVAASRTANGASKLPRDLRARRRPHCALRCIARVLLHARAPGCASASDRQRQPPACRRLFTGFDNTNDGPKIMQHMPITSILCIELGTGNRYTLRAI